MEEERGRERVHVGQPRDAESISFVQRQYLVGKDEGRDEADKGRQVDTGTTDDHQDNGEHQIVLGLGDHGCLNSRGSNRLGDHHNVLQEGLKG